MKSTASSLITATLLLNASCVFSPAAVLLTHSGGLVSESTLVVSSVGNIVRNDTSSGPVFFRYTVTNPASGGTVAENSFAAFELLNGGGSGTAGIGNNWTAWAYSVFGNMGNLDLNSANADPGQPYQLIRGTDVMTLAFSVNYNAGAADTLTVWLNPDFNTLPGAQSPNLTTTFSGDFPFTSLQLREGGAGNGWNFGNIQVATTAAEIGFIPEPSSLALGLAGLLGLLRRRR